MENDIVHFVNIPSFINRWRLLKHRAPRLEHSFLVHDVRRAMQAYFKPHLNIEPTLTTPLIDILYLVKIISHPNSSTALGALYQATRQTHCSESLLYLNCMCSFYDMDTIRPRSLPLFLSHWVKYTCFLYFFLWLTSPSPAVSLLPCIVNRSFHSAIPSFLWCLIHRTLHFTPPLCLFISLHLF